jgi:hypothetical protein
MGGGGGGFFRTSPDVLREELRKSEEATGDEVFTAAVSTILTNALGAANERDVPAVQRHLEEIKSALEKELDGSVDLMFGGSVAKHTYVEGMSDIDTLVLLDNCELAAGPPSEALEYFAKRLRRRFPNANVEVGHLAVTIRFADAEIQLLPAVSCRKNVRIGSPSSDSWSEIRPREFAQILTDVNARCANKLIPTVKLAKTIIGTLPEKHQITGYHAESLAVAIFRDYTGDFKPRQMLRHYFEEAATRVREPIVDRTGQSVHVDDYLGSTLTIERRIVADAFARVARRMRNADNAKSIDEWHKLLETD